MHAVRQSMRPKHQVLVLKCYPRYQKNAAEIKPNSSELSYLLYYASTRRSKIQKVGAFLEKKTATDVSRGKVGNVQVTLQIIRAMIDKSPRDLPLYAPYVLRILTMVLKSKDIGMVEDSVPTFQAFCEHQDLATLAADQELVKQYDEIAKGYAAFAGKSYASSKSPTSTPVAIRWKSAGLKAIKSISASESVSTDSGRQLSIILPVILENLYSDNGETLATLSQKAGLEKDTPSRRRMSVNTVRTTEPGRDSINVPASETTAEADRQSEEEAAMLALQSLKQIFSANNRVQIRLAITHILKFLVNRSLIARPETAASTKSVPRANWPTTLIEMVTRWTPVQDRFIIVLTTLETLIRSPTTEDKMMDQLVLGRLVQWLLGSSINMIGLSIIDVLLGLIQHVLILLQLGGKGTNVLPHHQLTDAIDLFKENLAGGNTTESGPDTSEETVSTPSAARQQLLNCLQKCIANLATHIYYSDQISDILTAILLRLKPSPASGLASATAAIEKPAAAAQAISESVHMKEDSSTNEFFSFGTARVTALNAVKEVLIIANKRGATVGAGAVGRNKVGVSVWEGTQWLLRDEDRRVRRAYVDALLTWMQLELNKKDLRIMEERSKSKKNRHLGEEESKRRTSLARATSNASRGSRAKPLKTTFMELLHLAVYDNALEAPEKDSDVLLMNLLLTSLVERLGVNAIKSGLPMIVRLQEDINASHALKDPKAKVNIGSLVHGYFLCLSKIFEFDTTMPGYEVQSEITRRQRAGLWMDRLQFPSLALDRLIMSSAAQSEEIPDETVQHETLKPFDSIASMVNQISIAYSNSISTAPSSPPQSPGRGTGSTIASPIALQAPVQELPASFKEVLLSKWSKEACIAKIEKDSARTVSPHGSRSGTTHSNGLLAVNGHSSRDISPAGAMLEAQAPTKGLTDASLGIQTSQLRRASTQGSGPPTPISNADRTSTLRVDDLKRVLAGGSLADAITHKSAPRNGSPLRNTSVAYRDFGSANSRYLNRPTTRPSIISAVSDSVVDAEGFESASEGDPEHPLPTPQAPISSKEIAEQYMRQLDQRPYDDDGLSSPRTPRPDSRDFRPSSRMSRPRSSSSASAEDPEANAKALKGELVPSVVRGSIVGDDGVPPVPPLPEGIVSKMPQSPQLKINPNLQDKTVSPISPTSLDGGAVGSTLTAPTAPAHASTLASAIAPRPVSASAHAPPPASALSDRSVGRNSLGTRSSIGNRSSLRSAGAGDRGTMVQALLGSIKVKVDGAGVGSRGSVGRPPY